ncbi:MAG: cyclopropane-fatty-acyl-phospholipid synthase family protein [Burkholderiaceae bacterium]
MEQLIRLAQLRLAQLPVPVALRLPDRRTVGGPDPAVVLDFARWRGLAMLVAGNIGPIAEGFVQGSVRIDGAMRHVMAVAAALLPGNPADSDTSWWRNLWNRARSATVHSPQRDAQQIQFHYDISDDFYALWLDPMRIYSCAYFAQPDMTLAQAQQAKLDHICRKLMLRPGERFLDIGSGWGGLLLWAAEHYGVDATGITLSRNQQAHVSALIEERGLSGRVRVELRDYRDIPADLTFDKIASVGMFEHVGQANLGTYFDTIYRLLKPGGLVLNHGITAGNTESTQLGWGIGDFVEKYIFPGGELLHVSHLLRETAHSGLEMLDTENLRPHYARTLWAWSDALETRLDEASQTLLSLGDSQRADQILRAYRLYLAGSAMGFERGWMALHQMLSVRADGNLHTGRLTGAQSAYPFNRGYMYAYDSVTPCSTPSSPKPLPI